MDYPREGALGIPEASPGPQAAKSKGPRLHAAFLLPLIPSEKVAWESPCPAVPNRIITVKGAAFYLGAAVQGGSPEPLTAASLVSQNRAETFPVNACPCSGALQGSKSASHEVTQRAGVCFQEGV